RPESKTYDIRKDIAKEAKKSKMSPLDYMLTVINDDKADQSRRDRLAIAAAPFCHEKVSERKPTRGEEKDRDATEAATDEFAVPSGPRLAVDNTKRQRGG